MPIDTPWEARAKELEPDHQHFADYVAWAEWAGKFLDKECFTGDEVCGCANCRTFKMWEDMDGLDRGAIYSMMWEALRYTGGKPLTGGSNHET